MDQLIIIAFRLFAIYLAFAVSRNAFRKSLDVPGTIWNATKAVIGLGLLAAFLAGTKRADEFCDPDPLRGGCVTYQVDVPIEERASRAAWIVALFGTGTTLGGIVGSYERRRKAREDSEGPDS